MYIYDYKQHVMSTLAFVDFEVNVFPDQDSVHQACLHYVYIQIVKNKSVDCVVVMNGIFSTLDRHFLQKQNLSRKHYSLSDKLNMVERTIQTRW